jgi:hypothetical protein
MKRILSFLVIASITLSVSSQTVSVPKNYILEKAEDYAPYQEKVLECMNWFINSNVDQNIELRKEVNTFILKWLIGSPALSVMVTETSKPILDDKDFQYTNDLLMSYMYGMAIYQLNNPNETDLIYIQEMGVNGVLTLYENNKGLFDKSKALKKYLKLKKDNQLKDWLIETNSPKESKN